MIREVLHIIWQLRILALTFLPFFFRKGRALYIRIKYGPPASEKKNSQLGWKNLALVTVLVTAAALQYITYAPFSSSEVNILELSDSTVKTSSEVIAARLRLLFGEDLEEIPGKSAGLDYDRLLDRLSSSEGRLLYTIYGTNAFASCEWCKTSAPMSFFYYVAPGIVFTHLLNFLPLGIITSSGAFSTPSATQFSMLAKILSLGCLALDLYLHLPDTALQMVVSSPDTFASQPFHWKAMFQRGLYLGHLDILFAVLVLLSATGFAFEVDEMANIHATAITKKLVKSLDRLRLSIMLQSSVIARDPVLTTAYAQWGQQVSVYESHIRKAPEVAEARKIAKDRIPQGYSQFENDCKSIVEEIFAA